MVFILFSLCYHFVIILLSVLPASHSLRATKKSKRKKWDEGFEFSVVFRGLSLCSYHAPCCEAILESAKPNSEDFGWNFVQVIGRSDKDFSNTFSFTITFSFPKDTGLEIVHPRFPPERLLNQVLRTSIDDALIWNSGGSRHMRK